MHLFKKINSEVKLGSFHFNNMKNVEARYEVIEKMNLIINFIVGEETYKVKDYILTLIVDEMILFLAVGQVSRKMSDSLLVIVSPKAKGVTRKWISTICGKEVIVKDKLECLTTFAPCSLPAKIKMYRKFRKLVGPRNARVRSNENEQL